MEQLDRSPTSPSSVPVTGQVSVSLMTPKQLAECNHQEVSRRISQTLEASAHANNTLDNSTLSKILYSMSFESLSRFY